MYLHEAEILSVRDSAIDIVHHNGKTFYWYRLLSRFPHMGTDMCDFWIAIGAPRDYELALPFLSSRQGILSGNSARCLRRIREFQFHAHVPSRVHIRICGA